MRALLAVVALLVGLAACTDTTDTADTVGPASTTAGTATASTASTAPGTTTTLGPGTTAPTATTAPSASGSGPEGVTFQPVITSYVPCEQPGVTPTAEPDVCHELGPAGFDGTAIAQVEVVDGGATGTERVVEVTLAEDARTQANELFAACASYAVTCPTGLLAIVVDGTVVTAPQVNGPDLADQPIVISGGGGSGFTPDEADDLAERLLG